MFNKFGRNPHTWTSMIENMAKGVDIKQIEDGKAAYQVRERKIAEAKMNRVFTSERCMSLLDEGSLEHEIRETI